MFDKPIEKMNFDELRSAVQVLFDAFERQRREYTDLLQNLDFDNLSSEVKDKVRSAVSEKTLEGVKESVITQTAGMISTSVMRQVDLKSAVAVSSKSQMNDRSKIYAIYQRGENNNVVGVDYYYYNDISDEWELIEGDSIYSIFQQTEDGFVFKGDVVVGGTLRGVDLIGATLEAGGASTNLKIKIRPDGDYRAIIDLGGLGTVAANPTYNARFSDVEDGLAVAEVSANGNSPLVLAGKRIIFDAGTIEGLGLPLVFS